MYGLYGMYGYYDGHGMFGSVRGTLFIKNKVARAVANFSQWS